MEFSKQKLIKNIELSYKKLRQQFDGISVELASEKLLEGQVKGEKMSICDLLAYLVGWGETMISWDNYLKQTGKIPPIPSSGWGEIAKDFYKKYEDYDFEELLNLFDTTVQEIVKIFSENSDEIMDQIWYVTKSSGREYSYARLVNFNTAASYKNAYNRIAKWKKGDS